MPRTPLDVACVGPQVGGAEFQGVIWVERPLLSSLMMLAMMVPASAHCVWGGLHQESGDTATLLPRRRPPFQPSL